MTSQDAQYAFRIGDAVLADFNAAQIPGVIEAERDGKYLVRLAQPWADEAGNKSDTAWLTPDRLTAGLNEETGSEQALPKST
ncbi:MAG: hypothetical protein ACRDFS_03045 [Chloroflexota bacterium]